MKNPIIILLLSLSTISFSQKELTALRVNEKISIDGNLDEAAWDNAEIATDFLNWQPVAGVKPSFKSEVKIMYDDNAVYIGGYMKTDSKSDIMMELTERDDVGNTDFISIIIDTYGNGVEASEFILCSTGVQFDAKVTASNGEDSNWNEVWYGEVKLTDNGWYAEMKIPYSALRFPKKDHQNWKINILRQIAKTGEKCSFQYIDPEVAGWVNQTAFLRGVSNIKSPIRLSLSPYVTGYAQSDYDPLSGDPASTAFSYNGGLDLKYGINEAFTLDMTLIPDFGQVQSDDRILNLSPFEVRYDENRSFFTEGFDMFDKANIFYSRRVGGTPINYWSAFDEETDAESLLSNPSETQLYNASKVSGRTKSGLGIGVFNAVAGGSIAKFQNNETDEIRELQTAPLTNYNVAVLDQNLPNNSSVSLINTNVWRKGAEFYNANVTGTEFSIRNKAQSWEVEGDGAISQLIYSDEDNINGLKYNVDLFKISGKFNYGISTSGASANYNSNDLGYNTQTNYRVHGLHASYQLNKGWKFLNRANIWFNYNLSKRYTDNAFARMHFNTGFWGQTKKLWQLNMWTNYSPESNDYFEPRIEGRYMKRPGFYNMGWYVSSDNRKKLRISGSVFGMKQFEKGAHVVEFRINPRYRFNDKFTLFARLSREENKNRRGFVDFQDDEPIIGMRDRVTFQNVIGGSYTFNSKMSLNLRVRHYWSKVSYNGFHGLDLDGNLTSTEFNTPSDFSFNALNLDLNYVWRFAPGSDLIFVWKNNISGFEDNSTMDFENNNYFNGVKSLSDSYQVNSFSIRLVYFLNGQNLF